MKRHLDKINREIETPEPATHEPTEEEVLFWMFDGVAEATDGCRVEPDGYCPHGHPSWLLELGII